jgi:hypothetical protein
LWERGGAASSVCATSVCVVRDMQRRCRHVGLQWRR